MTPPELQAGTARRCVVFSGLSASGKSTLAQALAAALNLPVIDKDVLLEALFERHGVGDASWRRRLSQAADEELRRQAEQAHGAVLVSWWRHPRSPVESGTPCDWLAALPGAQVEVHCQCSPAVAATRFMARQRHPGHLDGRWSHAALLESFEPQARLGALGVRSPVLTVETDNALDLTVVVQQVAAALERSPASG